MERFRTCLSSARVRYVLSSKLIHLNTIHGTTSIQEMCCSIGINHSLNSKSVNAGV